MSESQIDQKSGESASSPSHTTQKPLISTHNPSDRGSRYERNALRRSGTPSAATPEKIISYQSPMQRLVWQAGEGGLTAVEMVIPRAFSSGALSARRDQHVRVSSASSSVKRCEGRRARTDLRVVHELSTLRFGENLGLFVAANMGNSDCQYIEDVTKRKG